MKHKIIFLITLATATTINLQAQLNVGSTGAADVSAILQATSTTKGFLPPVMTTAQINAIVLPANGLTVYNTTLSQLQVNVGTPAAPSWSVAAGGANVYWSQQGNTGTVPGANYIGTTDNASIGFRTNGVERVRIDSATGNVGIGTTIPLAPLQFANVLNNRKIVLWDGPASAGNDSLFYGFGINSNTLRYQVPGAMNHSFYNNKTLIATLNSTSIYLKAANINFDSSALIGKGDSIGATIGIGITANGGLNMGQNTVGNNVFIGYKAGIANTTGSANQFIGYLSGISNTTGSANVFHGLHSGLSNTTGSGNQFIGINAGYSNTTGSNNQFDGYSSSYYNTTGNNNLFTGVQSGQNNTTGSQNQYGGFNSGYVNSTGSNNLFIGYQSGYNNSVSNNQFLGYQSGYNTNSGAGNLFIGYQSGLANTTTSNNQFIGYQSGLANTTGANNTFTGVQTGSTNTTGIQNVFTGFQSGLANTTGNHNTFTGYRTGYANTTGGENVFTGFTAGLANTTGSNNTFEGWQSGLSNSTGVSNSFIGYNSGISNTTGINNSFLGFSAGVNNTTGNNNTSLGFSSGPATSVLTNTTSIGANTLATVSNTVILGNGASVGIGTTTPVYKMDVISDASPLIRVGTTGSTGGGVIFGNANHGVQRGYPVVGADNNVGLFTTGANIYLATNVGAANHFVLTNNANVGIGTAAPSERLEVDGNLRLGGEPATAFVGWGSYIEFDGNGVNTDEIGLARYNVTVGGTNQSELRMIIGDDNQNSSGAHADRFVIGAGGGGLGNIAISSFTPGFFVYSQGQTGIGGVTPNSSYMLDVNGNIHTNASVIAGGTTLTSDRRLKKNIKGLNSALANVMKLSPVSYEKKSSISSTDYSFKEMGFVAQDLRKVFPQLVHEGTDADKTLSVDYNSLIPLLTKAIQEQQAQNDTQVAQIAGLVKANKMMAAQNAVIIEQNLAIAAHNKILDAQNRVISAQLSEMQTLKSDMAQMRNELNKTTITQVRLPLPVTTNN